MGIDIGKNSFHVVGLDRRGAMCCGGNRNAAHRLTPMPNRDGSLCRRTSPERKLQSLGHDARLMRLPRRGSHRRGGAAADDEIRRREDRGATRPASAAPSARAGGRPAHRRRQPDLRLPAGAWDAVRQGPRFLAWPRRWLVRMRLDGAFRFGWKCPFSAAASWACASPWLRTRLPPTANAAPTADRP